MAGKLMAGAIALALLTGCSSVVSAPPPATDEEGQVLYAEMLDRTWVSTGLSERMARPEIAGEAPLKVNDWTLAIVSCMGEEGYTQVAFHWEPNRGYYLDQVINVESSVLDDAELRFFVCVSRHPLDVLGDDSLQTREQLEYRYSYFQQLVVPCLLINGLDVSVAVTREEFVDTQGSWSPYQELTPAIRTSPGFDRLRTRCDA